MITTLTVEHFKSLRQATVNLGQVNVFIGPNGGGKSNLLEAIGVLSAAASGRVNDAALLARGVRTGLPSLYKSSFPIINGEGTQPSHIFLGAVTSQVEGPTSGYEITLNNPLKNPEPDWRFKHEKWYEDSDILASRSPRSSPSLNPNMGLAALRAVEQPQERQASQLLEALRKYVIYTPTTPVLRGTSKEDQPLHPLGLSGGRLPEAVQELLKQRGTITDDKALTDIQRFTRRVTREALSLIDWADSYGSAASNQMALSPAAASASRVVRFRDRYMLSKRNYLSGYDASEGALYVLLLAVLAAHVDSPPLFAVDNADHGLNPRLARSLMKNFCCWVLENPQPRQVLLTTHNPLVLDGLPLQDDRVRLFTVARNSAGRTEVQRVVVNSQMTAMAEKGWTLSRLWIAGHIGGVPRDI